MKLTIKQINNLNTDLKNIDERLICKVIDGEEYYVDVYFKDDKSEKWLVALRLTDENYNCYYANCLMPKLSIGILTLINEKYLVINNYDGVKIRMETFKNNETINHPSRYQTKSGKQLLDLLKEDLLSDTEYIGFLKGNFYKYIYRYQRKNGKEDLEKAQFYLEELKRYEYKD